MPDIEDLTNQNDAAKSVSQYYINLLHSLPVAIYWKDRCGKFLGCNAACAEKLGIRSYRDLVGKNIFDLTSKQKATKISKVDGKVVASGVTLTTEEYFEFLTGSEQAFSVKKSPSLDESNNITGLIGLLIDKVVTKPREADFEIHKNRFDAATLGLIVDNLPGHIYWKDINGRFLAVNNSQALDAGFNAPTEMLDKTDAEMPWKQQAEYLRKIDVDVMESGKPRTIEEIFELPDGTKKCYLSKKSPLYDNDGNLRGIIGVSFDITQRKLHERHLQDEKDRVEVTLEHIIANMPGHVYWKDIKGKFLGCNKKQLESSGLSSFKEIIGKTDYEMPWKDNAHKLRQADMLVMKTGTAKTVEEVSQLDNGRLAIFESKKVPLYDRKDSIIGILGISFDITDRKKYEAQLQAAKDRAESTLEHIIALMPGHVYWKDLEGRFIGCNQLQAETLGYQDASELIGKNAFETIIDESQANEIIATDNEIMSTGVAKTKEEPLTLDDGTTLIYLSNKVPLRDKQNKIIGILGISFDITGRKKAENKLKVEKQLAEERYEAMKTLAATIAHELRTPLATISTQGVGLQQHLPSLIKGFQVACKHQLLNTSLRPTQLSVLAKSAEKIEAEVRASYHFIDMLLVNVKQSAQGELVEQFSIVAMIHDALNRYPFNGSQGDWVTFDDSNDFVVSAKKLLLIHVMFNLLKNGLHYIAAKPNHTGKITITLNDQLKQIYFKDTGTGIAASELPFIFDRFYSKTHHGTGIGLAFCKTVMDDLGGSITCQSVLNKFTEFVLTFPQESFK